MANCFAFFLFFLVETVASQGDGSGSSVCPQACNCSSFPVVDCKHKGLSEVPLDLPDNLTHLYLEGNSISHLDALDKVSADLRSLIVLNLNDNKVTTLKRNTFKEVPRLQQLYLKNNRIAVIDEPATSFSSLSLLRLGDNPFQCDCQLLPFRRWLENTQVDIDISDILCSWPTSAVRVLDVSQNALICDDVDECSRIDRGGCQHRCVNSHGSYSCVCNPGYNIQSDSLSCRDINECLGSSNSCKQGCMNLEGNYVCRCTGNLVLAPDKKSCVVADQQSCSPEITVDDKGTFPWQQTTAGTVAFLDCPIGFQAMSTMVANATRMCNENRQWGKSDTSRCLYLSDTTRWLDAYSQATVSVGNRNQIAAVVKRLVSGAVNLSSDDLVYATTLLERVWDPRFGTASLQIGTDGVETVSQLVSATSSNLDYGQMHFQTSTRLLNLIEIYGESIALPFGISSMYMQSDNLAVRIIDSNPSSFDGATFVAVSPATGASGRRFDLLATNGKDSLLETAGDNMIAGIRLPPAVLNELGLSASLVRVQLVVYALNALFRTRDSSAVSLSEEWVVGSKVTVSGSRVVQIQSEVEIAIRHRRLGNHEVAVCAYWNSSVNDQLGGWLTDGCWRDAEMSNSKVTVCKCNHLTNFGILLTSTCANCTEHDRELHLEVYIGCGVSLFFVCLMFVLIALVREQKTSTYMKIQKNFAIAHIFIMVPFLAGIFRTSPNGVCQAVAAVLHFGLLSALVWLAIEAITFYIKQTRRIGVTQNTNILKRFAFAWGLPLSVVVSLVVIGNATNVSIYGGTEFCWIEHNVTLITTFYVPFGLLIGFNLVLYFLIHRVIGRTPQPADLLRLRTNAVTLTLFVLTVLFGCLVILGTVDEHLAFRVIFITFCVMHAGSMLLLQCGLNVEVRTKIKAVLFTNKQMLSYSRATSHTYLDDRNSSLERSNLSSVGDHDVDGRQTYRNPTSLEQVEDHHYRDVDWSLRHSRAVLQPSRPIGQPMIVSSGQPRRQQVYLSTDGRALYRHNVVPRFMPERRGERNLVESTQQNLFWQQGPWWSNSNVNDDAASGRLIRKSSSRNKMSKRINKQQVSESEESSTPQFV